MIIELVINHTSDQHPVVSGARQARPARRERDFYVWSDNDQKYKDARIIFTDTEKSNWTWDPVAKAYYWHRFFSPPARLELRQSRRPGRGAQRDAVLAGYGRGRAPPGRRALSGGARRHQLRKSARDARDPQDLRAAIDAEICQPVDSGGSQPVAAATCGLISAMATSATWRSTFPLMPRMFMAMRQEDRQPIVDIMQQTPAIPDTCQWGCFCATTTN